MSYVTKENTQDIYPLSPTQKGMLFHYVYDMSTPVYFEQLAFTINGPMQVEAFQNAWEHLISTTPIFRTVFRWSKTKEPVQIVLKNLPPVFRMHDFSNLDKIQQDEKIQQFLETDKSTPFDLEEGPLIRLNLIKLDESSHHFVWSHHHIIIDGWCLPIVLKDIFTTYLAHVSGNPLPSPIRRPYRDYIAWYLKQDKDASQTFWKEKLGTFVEPTPLPKDREPGETDSTGVGLETLLLGEEFSDVLLDIAKQERVTMNSLIQTAWAILLSRYSGMDDVVWGSTVSGRPVDLKGSEDMIGLFINTLPVRAIITEEMTVSDLIQSVQEFSLGMREYEYSLLPEVKACSSIPKNQNLFESIVVFENFPVDTVSMDDSNFGISNVKNFEMTNFPLTLLIAPGKRFSLDMHYHRAFFDETTIKRMMLHLQQILIAMATNVRAKVCRLEILTRQEREKILYHFNDTESPYPEDKCPYQLFEEQVNLTPDRVAVEFEGQVLTYRELNERVNQLAHYLRKKGVEPDAKVGLLLDRSFEMLTGILGIHKAGGSYVPMDPEYPKTRLEYMLKDSESPVLVTQRSLLDLISNREANTVLLDDDWKDIEQESKENPEPWAKPGNLSHLIYTSGSTGQPKGVMIEHRNLAAFLSWANEEFDYQEYEEMIASTSMCFDLSVFEFFLPLISGAKVIILRSSLDLDEFLTSNSATMINTVPSALKHLLSVMKKRHKIRAVNLAGEPLKLELVKDAYEKLDVDLVRNLYGPTEDTTYSTYFRIPKGYDREPLIGKPISNTTAFILDNYLNLVPVGIIGEIYLAGADLARGYWNAPEKTAERYIPNPFFADKYPYMYKTGDLGCWLPDGNIEFHGRVDYQVKIRGNRIELGEIETRLSIHPMISDVAVIDRDDRYEDKYLVAYYVSEEELSTTELRAFIKEELPDYTVPSRFILMDALPLSPNGKIDRKALPELDSARPEMASDYIEPRNDLEQILAKVWQDVLGIDTVGIHDNFFDLGGDSIISLQVVGRLKTHGYQIRPKDIFENSTIAELAPVLERNVGIKAEQEPVVGDAPLTPIQKWFFDRGFVNEGFYNQSLIFKSSVPLDETALQKSLQAVLDHHDILRARFKNAVQQFQNIGENVFFTINDIGSIAELEQEINTLQSSLNLHHGPVFGAGLFHMDGLDYVVFIGHHLVIDGVSWRIIAEDIIDSYRMVQEGSEIRLPDKTTSYKTWSQKILEYSGKSDVLKEVFYWNEVLSDEIPQLIVDHDLGENTFASSMIVNMKLDEENTGNLLKEANKVYNTDVNDLLLAALMRALMKLTDHDTIVFDLEGHGREDVLDGIDISRTVGWFTSIYPVILDVGRNADLSTQIKYVKETLRGIPNKGFNYGVLKYAENGNLVQPERSQVLFNYLGQMNIGELEDVFEMTDEVKFFTVDPKNERTHLIDINCNVENSQLIINVGFSTNKYRESTIRAFTQNLKEELINIVKHCMEFEAEIYTPSDFELADISQDQLDALVEDVE